MPDATGSSALHLPYIPQDRRQAQIKGHELPTAAEGAVLFADISGFTALTNAYVAALGPQRGAETATHQLNQVYEALIRSIEEAKGSVVGFSGDGMLCWFARQPGESLVFLCRRALHCAQRLHTRMASYQAVTLPDGTTVELGLKVVLAQGDVRRFVVGDPAIQLIDVLAGGPVERSGQGEALAQRSEILIDPEFYRQLGSAAALSGWRGQEGERFAVLAAREPDVDGTVDFGHSQTSAQLDSSEPEPAEGQVLFDPAAWLLPGVRTRLAVTDEDFLAELRPGVALFGRFTGVDFQTETAIAELDRMVRWIQLLVQQLDGALLQLTVGDKGSYFYVAFGPVAAHDDDAQRAAAAALELLGYRAVVPAVETLQIGMAQGRLRVGAYGSSTRRTFGAQGAAVNLAARLMMQAHPDTIALEAGLAEAIGDTYESISLGTATLKGLSEPIEYFALLGRRSHAGRRDERETVELVGREPVLAEISRLLQAVIPDGGSGAGPKPGQSLLVRGGVGLGKSVLAHAALGMAETKEAAALFAVGESTAQHVVYSGLTQLLREALSPALVADSPEEQAEDLASWLREALPRWQGQVGLLCELLGLPIPRTDERVMQPPELRQQTVADLTMDILAYCAQSHGCMVVVDDVQWLDEASQFVLAQVAARRANAPLLLVGLARQEAAGEPAPGPAQERFVADKGPDDSQAGAEAAIVYDHELELEPLADAAIYELLTRRFGAVDELLGNLILRLAQGNPLYAVALLASWLEQGDVAWSEGVWSLHDDFAARLRAGRILIYGTTGWEVAAEAASYLSAMGVPDSLQGLQLARFDQLDESLKLTLKAAAVIGRRFDLEILCAAHPSINEPAMLASHLAALVRTRLIQPDSAGPAAGTSAYRFEQSFTQEVVYATLLSSQLRGLHGAVAQALETAQPGAFDQLAHHYYHSDLEQEEMKAKAVYYLEQAVAGSRREYANETALLLLDRLQSLDQGWQRQRERIEVLHLLGWRKAEWEALQSGEAMADGRPAELALLRSRYFEATADYEPAMRYAETALRLAHVRDEHQASVRTLVQLARIAGREGDYAQESDYYRQALAAMEGNGAALEDSGLLIQVRYGLGIVYQQQGEFEAATRELTAALSVASAEENLVEEARVRTALGVTARLQRRFDVAGEHTEAALALRRRIGDRRGEGDSLLSLAQVVIHGLGEYGRGRDLLEEALALQRAIGNQWSEAVVLNELGILHLMVGQYQAAQGYLRSALRVCHIIGADAGIAHVACNLGLVLREVGLADEATTILQQGIEVAEELGDPHTQAQLMSELAMTQLALDDIQAARRLAAEAAAALDELGLRIMTTPDLVTQAQAELAAGDSEQARYYTQLALALLEECDGDGPDFPHRDAYLCARVLARIGDHAAAEAAFAQARRWLLARAERIQDADLRKSFLEAIGYNTAILSDEF